MFTLGVTTRSNSTSPPCRGTGDEVGGGGSSGPVLSQLWPVYSAISGSGVTAHLQSVVAGEDQCGVLPVVPGWRHRRPGGGVAVQVDAGPVQGAGFFGADPGEQAEDDVGVLLNPNEP
jgi:hypothetical protein